MSRTTSGILSADLAGARQAAAARLFADFGPRLVGLMVVALLPALFWTGAASAIATLVHVHISPAKIVGFGGAIALFLTAVCAPIILRAR